LISEGHVFADSYPIIKLISEAAICRDRINNQLANESILQQAMIGSVLNGKSGAKPYRDLIRRLTNGEFI